MTADYHTHTPLCHHAIGEPQEYVAAALAAGLTEYGIADHAPVGEGFFDDWRMLASDLPRYWDWIAAARDCAADRIAVRAGMECDWLPGCEAGIAQLRGAYSWDYLIGSVHYLQGWDFDNPCWLGRWAETDVEQAWQLYCCLLYTSPSPRDRG